MKVERHFGYLKSFIIEAGKLSLAKLSAAHEKHFKNEAQKANSIVTEIDIEISAMFKKFLQQYFPDLNYMVIDEENIDQQKDNLFEQIDQTEYQFIIDPIDGTINYASGNPLYGISVAVMKNRRIIEGYIYAPALGELMYTNGKKAYIEKEGRMMILNQNIIRNSQVLLAHPWTIERAKPNKYIWEDYFSAVIYFLFIAQGRAKGGILRANLWDIAGGMAIIKALGLGLYTCDTQEEIDCVDEKWFEPNLKVKVPYIICHPTDFEEIKQAAGNINFQ